MLGHHLFGGVVSRLVQQHDADMIPTGSCRCNDVILTSMQWFSAEPILIRLTRQMMSY